MGFLEWGTNDEKAQNHKLEVFPLCFKPDVQLHQNQYELWLLGLLKISPVAKNHQTGNVLNPKFNQEEII